MALVAHGRALSLGCPAFCGPQFPQRRNGRRAGSSVSPDAPGARRAPWAAPGLPLATSPGCVVLGCGACESLGEAVAVFFLPSLVRQDALRLQTGPRLGYEAPGLFSWCQPGPALAMV